MRPEIKFRRVHKESIFVGHMFIGTIFLQLFWMLFSIHDGNTDYLACNKSLELDFTLSIYDYTLVPKEAITACSPFHNGSKCLFIPNLILNENSKIQSNYCPPSYLKSYIYQLKTKFNSLTGLSTSRVKVSVLKWRDAKLNLSINIII